MSQPVAMPVEPDPVADSGPGTDPGSSRRIGLIVAIAVLSIVLVGLVVALTLVLGDGGADSANNVESRQIATSTSTVDNDPTSTADTTSPQSPTSTDPPTPAVPPTFDELQATLLVAATNEGLPYKIAVVGQEGGYVGFSVLEEAGLGLGMSQIQTWVWEGQSWAKGDALDVPDPVFDLVMEGDLTGDGEDDLIVWAGSNHFVSAVLTRHGGHEWLFAQFGDETWVEPLIVKDGVLQSTINSCQPSCADGDYYTLFWDFDQDRQRFDVIRGA
ncbi:MAG: hypothetical protein V9F03_02795 [Microthrixaceae bacterium]